MIRVLDFDGQVLLRQADSDGYEFRIGDDATQRVAKVKVAGPDLAALGLPASKHGLAVLLVARAVAKALAELGVP